MEAVICGQLMLPVTAATTYNAVTLPKCLPRQEARDCHEDCKKRPLLVLRIPRTVKLEASICRKCEIEATACRKYKFSLGGTTFIHETTPPHPPDQSEINGNITITFQTRGGSQSTFCVINNQSTNYPRRLPNRVAPWSPP